MKIKLDNVGTLGVWVAALSCPACFPALISLASALGLGFLSTFEGIAINYLLPFFALLVLLSNLYSWYQHRNHFRGLISVFSPVLILFVLYVFWVFSWSRQLFYIVLFLMPLVAIFDLVKPAATRC
ncbi:MAG: organomercurial transporter MerC [SAR324 cluster bacterium]|jgi:mercuric ion transport protein|nr:organomercurial transporter MerC [SAR324 cluster bacterium]HIB25014.1 organomercurial transporter MerC [Gammaproteobacteria bacterium]